MFPQQSGTNGMECAQINVRSSLADYLFYPLLHFAGCFIRKRYSKNMLGRYIAFGDEISDPGSQHPGFSAAGASEY